ncbi:MAG: DUF1097 domain-containing protein [Tissierellales bacterium]|nr:DUF1097 domain-containing protein [Tissierellales bacterium]
MSRLLASAIATALLCAFWAEGSVSLGLITWAGFAGCTTFFAGGAKSQGFFKALRTNACGVFWAMMAIWFCEYADFIPFANGISTFIITFAICTQIKWKKLDFMTGVFIGCFSTFASGGQWLLVLASLACGAVLGFACEKLGDLIYNVSNQNISIPSFRTKRDEMVSE